MKTIEAVLTPPEISYALSLATQRDACKTNPGYRLSKVHSGFGVNFAGVLGEVLFRKVYGGKLNTQILPNGDGHAPDIIMDDGREVEVKTSLFQGREPKMIFEKEELDCAGHCCLVQLTLPDTGKVSPIYEWSFIEPRLEKANFGYGERWVFNPAQHKPNLNPFRV